MANFGEIVGRLQTKKKGVNEELNSQHHTATTFHKIRGNLIVNGCVEGKPSSDLAHTALSVVSPNIDSTASLS